MSAKVKDPVAEARRIIEEVRQGFGEAIDGFKAVDNAQLRTGMKKMKNVDAKLAALVPDLLTEIDRLTSELNNAHRTNRIYKSLVEGK